MNNYLISLMRNDMPQEYPYELKADDIGKAVIKAVEQSYYYKPTDADSAFCLVSAHEMEQGTEPPKMG